MSLLLVVKNWLFPMKQPLPNFSAVEAGQRIYRGGQPTAEGWRRLSEMGVMNVVKLNEDSAFDGGPDDEASFYGMEICKHPIDEAEQLFQARKSRVDDAVSDIRPGTYVHCLHGEDRTGVVCYFFRRSQGWSHEDACREMLNHGFHKSLHGLWELVEKDCE